MTPASTKTWNVTPCNKGPSLAVIGASTGGPGAILKVLSAISTDNDLSIIIVQHIEASFISGFVTWLQSELNRPVSVAQEGERPVGSMIYVAGAKGNLELTPDLKFKYVSPPKGQLYTPNINHFFSKLAKMPFRAYAALLTGMGDDGARGIMELANSGWNTYVQKPDTCVVSGMPDTAIRLSARHAVAEPDKIGQFMQTYALSTKRRSYAGTHE